MREVGETILQKSHYAASLLDELGGVEMPFKGFFKEFPVMFTGRKVKEVNRRLLKRGIMGGKDLTREYPELGQSALYCVTEVHTVEQIEALASALREVTE
jgi:glycine dehydrogenase subunit 1